MRWLGCSFQFIKITLRKETWLSVMFFDNSSRGLSVERFVIGMYSGSMIREVSNGCWPSKPKSHDPATREVPLDCGWGEALPNSASNFAFISCKAFFSGPSSKRVLRISGQTGLSKPGLKARICNCSCCSVLLRFS